MQQIEAVATMNIILEQPLDSLLQDPELRIKFQDSATFLVDQPDLLGEEKLGILSMLSNNLDSKLQKISLAIEHKKKSKPSNKIMRKRQLSRGIFIKSLSKQ